MAGYRRVFYQRTPEKIIWTSGMRRYRRQRCIVLDQPFREIQNWQGFRLYPSYQAGAAAQLGVTSAVFYQRTPAKIHLDFRDDAPVREIQELACGFVAFRKKRTAGYSRCKSVVFSRI